MTTFASVLAGHAIRISRDDQIGWTRKQGIEEERSFLCVLKLQLSDVHALPYVQSLLRVLPFDPNATAID